MSDGRQVEIRTYLQPDNGQPLPPPARVIAYMQRSPDQEQNAPYEYPSVLGHGVRTFSGSNIYVEIGQNAFKELRHGGIRIFRQNDMYYQAKADVPDVFGDYFYQGFASLELLHWIEQAGAGGAEITTLRRMSEFSGTGNFLPMPVDMVRQITIDDLSGRINIVTDFINPSETEPVQSFRYGECYYSDAWFQIDENSGSVFNRGFGPIPGNRLVRSAADTSPFTQLGIYTPDDVYGVQCIIDETYQQDPDFTLAGNDVITPGNPFAELCMAWSLGYFEPREWKRIHHIVIAGTDDAAMYQGLT